jgi:metallo-beta-lactamase family protein
MDMTLQFQGAARTVTGSMHVVRINGTTLLLDCGTFHGRREEARQRNSAFPFDPASVSAVVLSHAHIDHSGNLPTLVRQGFRGTIYCTHATQSLCEVMLKDSAYIQERDAEFITARHRRRGLPAVEPLYTEEDVNATIPLMRSVDYSKTFELTDGATCRFEDAGHILGSASVALHLKDGSKEAGLAFTGDLGRTGLPILRDPVFIGDGQDTDTLICESTYGGRFHARIEDMGRQLLEPLRRAFDRNAKVVIPAFSVGRTQELVYVLHGLVTHGDLPAVPVFVDSPLSVNVTRVFRQHPECFDAETRAILQAPEANDPFGFNRLTYVQSREESVALNDRPGPFLVISASGMCEAGRVVHHLSHSVTDPRNMVIIVGYQAENTLGKKIVMKEPEVNIFGEPHALKAEVVVLNSFSSHADRNDLLAYVRRFGASRLKNIYLVHGDLDQAEKLRDGLVESGFRRVHIPARGDTAPLV